MNKIPDLLKKEKSFRAAQFDLAKLPTISRYSFLLQKCNECVPIPFVQIILFSIAVSFHPALIYVYRDDIRTFATGGYAIYLSERYLSYFNVFYIEYLMKIF